MKKPPRAWSRRRVHGVDICKIDTLDGVTNLSQITWNWPGFKTKSPVLGKPEWLVPNFRFVHFAICMLFLNFYKSGKEKKINKEKNVFNSSPLPSGQSPNSFLTVRRAFAAWPMCVSSFSRPASLLAPSLPATLTADSSLNMPCSLLHKLVPLLRNPFP